MSPPRMGSANRDGDGVTLRGFDSSLITTDDDWLENLVPSILFVPLLDCGNRVLRRFALVPDRTLGGDLDTLPPLVTVHSVVPTNNDDELSSLLLLDEVGEFLAYFVEERGAVSPPSPRK